MKFTHTKTVTDEVTHIRIEAAVRYGTEDMPRDFPMREGDTWKATVEIATGIIRGWPQGKSGEFRMKVCDEGTYTLLDATGAEVEKIEDGYVPNSIIPGKYGDYIQMVIAADGTITNWPKHPSLEDFQ